MHAQKYADMYMACDSEGGRKIACHRFIMEKSGMLDNIITSLTTTTTQEDSGKTVVHVPEQPFEILEKFVEYVYTGTLQLTPTTIMGLLKFSVKYSIASLLQKCLLLILGVLDGQTCCEVLGYCEDLLVHGQVKDKECELIVDGLKNVCVRYATARYGDVSNTTNWESLPPYVKYMLTNGSTAALTWW